MNYRPYTAGAKKRAKYIFCMNSLFCDLSELYVSVPSSIIVLQTIQLATSIVDYLYQVESS